MTVTDKAFLLLAKHQLKVEVKTQYTEISNVEHRRHAISAITELIDACNSLDELDNYLQDAREVSFVQWCDSLDATHLPST